MSVYYKGKLISGIREIPQMTLSEYNALSVKPDMWVRTDSPDSDRGIDADDIEYDENNSVKDKIDDADSKLNNIKIRAGIVSNINLTANTQAEVTVTIPNSPFSGGDYGLCIDFEYYSSANIITHIIRNSYSNGFVVRIISTVNASDVKMHWIAVGV